MTPFQKKILLCTGNERLLLNQSCAAGISSLSLSYDDLEIADGGTASRAFESLQTETDLMFIAEIKQQLLEYCKLDTLGMVRILEKLETIGGESLMQAPCRNSRFSRSLY